MMDTSTESEESSSYELEIDMEAEMDTSSSSKVGHVQYRSDQYLPRGWQCYDSGRGMSFKDERGRRFSGRRKVLEYMIDQGTFSKETIYYVRDGLLDEGWSYHQQLPPGWMFKQYTHKIEGVNTNILYHLSPRGIIYRSKVKIKKEAEELKLSSRDLKLLLDFKPDNNEEPRKIEDPDSDWVCDEHCPTGWRRKRYCYKSGLTKKIEQVFHYLSPHPDNYVLRGKKQVYEYMKKSGTFNTEDFKIFHFNTPKATKDIKERLSQRRNKLDWGGWSDCQEELGPGWMSRQCLYKNQKKVQYKAPSGKKFQSRILAVKYIKAEAGGTLDSDMELTLRSRRRVKSGQAQEAKKKPKQNEELLSEESEKCGESEVVWEGWREDEIPSLLGWQFSIGRLAATKVIKYKSPSGEVFSSRGSLLRYLKVNKLKNKEQLATLKKKLKTYQGLPFSDLLKNDKFIKNFEPDTNYLEFLRVRYLNESHSHIEEEIDDNLPADWRKKNINGVEYFRDPSGLHVFNSRKLVVDHLRKNDIELSREQLQRILNESESESDLTDSEDGKESHAVSNDNNNIFPFVSC